MVLMAPRTHSFCRKLPTLPPSILQLDAVQDKRAWGVKEMTHRTRVRGDLKCDPSSHVQATKDTGINSSAQSFWRSSIPVQSHSETLISPLAKKKRRGIGLGPWSRLHEA
ncbi:hypothetical protein V3481_003616 [Fusarium oxysporum f. sp. vasinfectum]